MQFVLRKRPPDVEKSHVPSDKYRERCDETLGDGPFFQRGTAEGFLDTGNKRPSASKNLVMLGGSFVESMFVDELDRFPSIVERGLPEEWQVLNGGYSGMTTLHLLPLLTSKVPTVMSPGSKLLLFIGQSDVNAMGSAGIYWSDSKTLAPIEPRTFEPFSPWGPKEAVERTVDALLSVAEAFDFDYGVVASPFRDGDFSNDPVLRATYRRQRALYERAVERRRFIQDIAQQVTEFHGRPYFDGQSVVEPNDFYDVIHLNSKGQYVFAEALSSWLVDW